MARGRKRGSWKKPSEIPRARKLPVIDKDLSSIFSGNTVRIKCKVKEKVFVRGSFEIYSTSVGFEALYVRGVFPHDFHLGSYYEVEGRFAISGGRRVLDVESYTLSYPTEPQEIQTALTSLLSNYALIGKLVKCFGDQTLFLLESAFGEIQEVLDCTEEETEELGYAHKKLKAKREKEPAVLILSKFSLPLEEISQILKHHPVQKVLALEEEPYEILEMTREVSLKEVDQVALKGGYPIDGMGRMMAIALHCAKVLILEEGHTIVAKEDLREAFREIASVPISKRDAEVILKAGATTNDTPRRVAIGGQEIIVDVKALRTAYNSWSSDTTKKKSPFSYPLLALDEDTEEEIFQLLEDTEKLLELECDGEECYQLMDHFLMEQMVTKKLGLIQNSNRTQYEEAEVKQTLASVLTAMSQTMGHPIDLEPEQENSILGICSSPYGASILTGPAGSGKTFVLKIIIQVLTQLRAQHGDKEVTPQILAPTGRAAQVATKATKLQASTIHRYFKIGVEEDKFDRIQEATLYIVDEFSMVDISLFSSMLESISGEFKILFVGDPEQLPSVEAGCCLRDLIASKAIPHYHLKTAKRQASGSGVLINATKIINGQSIQTEIVKQGTVEDNAYLIYCTKEAEALERVKAFLQGVGLQKFQEDVVQILCPTKNDALGVNALNLLAQSLLNPYQENPEDSEGRGHDRAKTYEEYQGKALYLQVGDKVMNMKNNYHLPYYRKNLDGEYMPSGRKGVMNGETGVVVRIYRPIVAGVQLRRVIVAYEDGFVMYENQEILSLGLAYAITIHKSQGSQWPVVLSPLMKYYEPMHTRNLLYTMYTRAEKTCYLIGGAKDIQKTIENNGQSKRRTRLQQVLLQNSTFLL